MKHPPIELVAKEPPLVCAILDALTREVVDFLDLVPNQSDAIDLLLISIDQGVKLHEERQYRYWHPVIDLAG